MNFKDFQVPPPFPHEISGLGRRIEKRSGDQITTFVWDGDALVGDWIEDPTDPVVPAKGMAREWVYYPETFEPLALLGGRSGPNTLLHYHNDPNGCPIRLTDSKGEILWAASYTAWGQIARLHVGYVDNPIRLQGQYEDGETGLHYNRHRYCESRLGIFISDDPFGLDAGENLYAFAANPINWVDPHGLRCSQVITREGKTVLQILDKFPAGSYESRQLRRFVAAWNQEIARNGGSMVRRTLTAVEEKASAIWKKQLRRSQPARFKDKVVGHVPDASMGGTVANGRAMALSTSVNSYLGGVAGGVPVGTRYHEVELVWRF